MVVALEGEKRKEEELLKNEIVRMAKRILEIRILGDPVTRGKIKEFLEKLENINIRDFDLSTSELETVEKAIRRSKELLRDYEKRMSHEYRTGYGANIFKLI